MTHRRPLAGAGFPYGGAVGPMSPLRLRALLTGTSRRLAVLLAVLGLGGAIVAHHSVPAGMAMGGAHGEHATAACPAVLSAAGAIAVIGVVGRRRRAAPLPRARLALSGPSPMVAARTAARSRAGPKVPLFLLLGVLRR